MRRLCLSCAMCAVTSTVTNPANSPAFVATYTSWSACFQARSGASDADGGSDAGAPERAEMSVLLMLMFLLCGRHAAAESVTGADGRASVRSV